MLGKTSFLLFVCFLIGQAGLQAQQNELEFIPAVVDFSYHLQEWDGFGFNYVEAAQARDYDSQPQDYGGFSLLDEEQKAEILDLVFGEQGLQVQIVKMFLDPYHQDKPCGEYDHEKTTRHMMDFVKRGLEISRSRGDELEIITTLYGPPAWATRQGFIGGRDLDTAQNENLARYMAHWVRYLSREGIPVKYLSLHNEGEDFYRWDFSSGKQRLESFDYNMYWPPEQVNAYLKRMPAVLDQYGMGDVSVTNGEPSNWTRFYHWGYAGKLAGDSDALDALGLLTTHGFINGNMAKLSYSTSNGLTTSMLRKQKPGLHAWTTSFSWGEMGLDFVRMVHENIYSAGVNAVIPWAGIQDPEQWIGGDPNPGTAIRVSRDGSYDVLKGYCFYKQLTLAGHRGMAVAYTTLANPQAFLLAFAGKDSPYPDAFVLSSNIYIWKLPIRIEVKGSAYKKFAAYRSSESGEECFEKIGIFEVRDGFIHYDPPQGSTTTFIGIPF